jgi:MFS family permease
MREHCSMARNNTSPKVQVRKNNMTERLQEKFRNIPKELLLIFLAIGITLLGDSSLYVLLPIYAVDIGIPVASVGVILSLNRFVRLITNYYAKNWYSYFGGKRLLIFSVVISAVTTLFYGLPVGVVVICLSRIIWGACWSSMRLVGFVSIAENSTNKNRGTLTGFYHSASRIGSLLSIFLGGILSNSLGYRNTFYIFAFLTFVIGMPLSYYGMSKQRGSGDETELPAEDAEFESAEEDNATSAASFDINISLKSTCFMTFLNSWVGNGLLLSTISYVLLLKFGKEVNFLNMTIGVSIAASFLVSLKWFYDIFLSVVFGRLADRFGHSRIIIINFILQIISLLVIAYTQSFVLIILAAIIGFGGVTALTSTLDAAAIGYQSKNKDKNILGHFTTWQDLGAAFGALAGYSLVIALGYSRTYLITVLMIVVAIVFAIKDSVLKKYRAFNKI